MDAKSNIKDIVLSNQEKIKKEFMKKTSKEKFEELFEDLSILEDRIESFNECCCDCDSEIEEVKFSQKRNFRQNR